MFYSVDLFYSIAWPRLGSTCSAFGIWVDGFRRSCLHTHTHTNTHTHTYVTFSELIYTTVIRHPVDLFLKISGTSKGTSKTFLDVAKLCILLFFPMFFKSRIFLTPHPAFDLFFQLDRTRSTRNEGFFYIFLWQTLRWFELGPCRLMRQCIL